MGGDLEGTGERSPKFEVGNGPCIRPPNIFRSSVTASVAKYELTKKRCQRGNVCSEIEVFIKKRVIYVIYEISDSRDRQKTDKIWSMTKKRSSEIFGV